jgi:vitamin B12/bleomycin/antimicrobial peptide transport system ATP-binding/permease protein
MSPASQPNSAKSQFRFNKKLWNQFLDIAQPYFYPKESGGIWVFVGLLIAALFFVVSLRFFLTTGFTLAGQLLMPEFFKNLAPGLVSNINKAINSPIIAVATLSIILVPLLFVALREKLKDRWLQWSLLVLVLFLAFMVTGLNVVISYTFRFIDNSFTDFASAAEAVKASAAAVAANAPGAIEAAAKSTAIEKESIQSFWQFLWLYAGVLVVAIPILVGYVYVQLKLALFWREWLTKVLLGRYFGNRAYYELNTNSANSDVDNPDQRITEDVRSFTTTTLDFLLDILTSFLDIINFSFILYGIGAVAGKTRAPQVELAAQQLTGGLWFYAIFGSAIAAFLGTKLIKLNFQQLKYEADFRYGMVHVRDNAESIAFYRGEGLEENQINRRFLSVFKNSNALIIWRSFLGVFQRAYNYFSRLVPYAIIAPLFFAKQIDFGTIGQGIFAFSMVLSSLSIIINRIQDISAFSAGIRRIAALNEKLDANQQTDDRAQDRIQTHLANQFILTNLTLRTPDAERTLFDNLSLHLEPNEPLLVVGPSGCGKSSMMRALAGLWTNGSGTIERPDNSDMLFLPQKPYMLLGTLREQLQYPNLRADIQDNEIRSALTAVNLDRLQDTDLDLDQDWGNVLSLGEQQRLAFARILLNEPSYVILDEATSALDIKNEQRLYQLLQDRNLSYISVGHRPNLVNYHRRVLQLQGDRTWQVMAAADYRFDAV